MRSLIRPTAVLLALAAVSAASKQAAAQGWSLDAYAGRANYNMLPSTVSSNSGVLGVRFNQNYRFFQTAFGAPLGSKDVAWGVVEWGDRFAVRLGSFAAGADVSAQANAERDPVADAGGAGLLAEALPMIHESVRFAAFELRSGPRWYGARLAGADWTRTLWTTDFQMGVPAGESVRIESHIRHDRSRQAEAYTRLGFTAAATLKQVALQAAVGDWIGGAPDTTPEWDLDIAVPIRSGVSFFASAQHESFNPQFLAPPRTSWGIGLTFRIGGSSDAPRDGAIEVGERGKVAIGFPRRESPTPPSIAGDFTGWKPVAMEGKGDRWTFSVELSPGVYRFAFRTADGKWFVPDSIPNRTSDGMGGSVAVLVVP